MRIVSWNLHGAFVPGRATREQQDRAWHHLAALDPHVALLQEVGDAAVPDWARERWTIVAGEVGVAEKRQAWGSAIVAKPALGLRPCRPRRRRPVGPGSLRLRRDR